MSAYPMQEYRRRLPHIHPQDSYLFLTWRLWGSLPAKVDTHPFAYPTSRHSFVAQDRPLDRDATGPLWLKHSAIANLVAEAILLGEIGRHFYELHAWVVMPNHVHILILPRVPVSVIMRWLKGSTARSANKILGRTGQPFWQDESYDHFLRDPSRIGRTVSYIENNPVSAGLVCCAEKWPWSSAGWRAQSHNVT